MAPKSGKSKKQPAGKGSGLRRLALIVFSVLFVGLFVGFAVAQGVGQPSVPAGDVAMVEGVPSDLGAVSEAEFKRSFAQQAAQGGQGKVPKEGSEKYEELKTAAMTETLEQVWLRGEAEERGISVTPKQVSTELAQIKKENFKAPGSYQEFLKNSSFTPEDVERRVEVQVLSTQIQEAISNSTGPASKDEIQTYYDAEKASQFTTPPSRDVRVIINTNKSEVEKAKEALEKDNSPANWNKVAAKYSTDPSTKGKGGLQTGVPEEFLKGELKKAVFETPTNQLAGPVKNSGSYLLVEPVKINPEKIQKLPEVTQQISSTLTQQNQEEALQEFVAGYQSKWISRTFCASGFLVQNCSNYASDGHPESAVPACYEADPEVAATECPAPVAQAVPALPGTVTPTQPKGEPFPQRPR
ncbi:MAG: SurA N-terminal domain-containing protein, partial [Solirubrobacterales bacterium]